jgi:hypothetical protein
MNPCRSSYAFDSEIEPYMSNPPSTSSPALMAGRNYHCQCGSPVFFRNSTCLACGTPLGFDPALGTLLPLMQAALADLSTEPPTWVRWSNLSGGSSQAVYRRCANLLSPASCNWLVPFDSTSSAGPLLCRACRLNRTIPDLNDLQHPENALLWGRIELAKRRLVSSLLALGLPVASRVSEDTERGVAFDVLRAPDGAPSVLTGHSKGLITLNLLEADDAFRETTRGAMGEPYRTLLGHFRHEIGHYYWDRLVCGTPWMDGFHQLFGDETLDYAAALRQNYEQGPLPNWPQQFVSAYASSHPWEDWAECWAHYLHMRDTLDTALSFGLVTSSMQLEFTPFNLDTLYQPEHPGAQQFLDFLNDWTRLTTLLNEMSRSMGQIDFYPFVLPKSVVAKLHFIDLVVGEVASSQASQSMPLQPGQQQMQSQSFY